MSGAKKGHQPQEAEGGYTAGGSAGHRRRNRSLLRLMGRGGVGKPKPVIDPKKEETLVERCQRYSSRERGDWTWEGRPSHRQAAGSM